MTFLALLAEKLIEWLLAKGWNALAAWIAKMTRRNQIKKEADTSVEPLKNAKTGEEVENATDSTLSGL